MNHPPMNNPPMKFRTELLSSTAIILALGVMSAHGFDPSDRRTRQRVRKEGPDGA